jgi:hypothetical protein
VKAISLSGVLCPVRNPRRVGALITEAKLEKSTNFNTSEIIENIPFQPPKA